ncbi:MAG: hypothetical protein KC776_15560 [Myxococcales bacterium]|nr:hypothetical protein [Myxococcales bacterium]MCB9582618.1 hypothetical protein [Polyangiaceae bacterium]
MRHLTPIIILLVVGLLACKGVKEKLTGGSAPSASAGVALAPSSSAPVAGGEDAVPAPESPQPRPLKVGQFVRYKVTENGDEREFSYSVIGAEGDAHWIQVITEKSGRRVVMQLLLAIGDRTDPKSAKLRGLKMKAPGLGVREFRGASLAAMRKQVDLGMSELTVPGLTGLKQEDVTVPAGTFKSCYTRDTTTTFLGITAKQRQWIHTRVPILALVKSKALDKNYQIELEEYGETGAKDELG